MPFKFRPPAYYFRKIKFAPKATAHPIPNSPPPRFWTNASIECLAERFDLAFSVEMQDWPYENANPQRLPEFVVTLADYKHDPDVQFTLMDIVLQSFEDSTYDLAACSEWSHTKLHLLNNFDLHAHQIWYWSAFKSAGNYAWRISPFVREIWNAKDKQRAP